MSSCSAAVLPSHGPALPAARFALLTAAAQPYKLKHEPLKYPRRCCGGWWWQNWALSLTISAALVWFPMVGPQLCSERSAASEQVLEGACSTVLLHSHLNGFS